MSVALRMLYAAAYQSCPNVQAATFAIEQTFIDKVVPEIGLVMSVYDILSMEGGIIHHSDGGAHFVVKFRLVGRSNQTASRRGMLDFTRGLLHPGAGGLPAVHWGDRHCSGPLLEQTRSCPEPWVLRRHPHPGGQDAGGYILVRPSRFCRRSLPGGA